MSWDIVLFNSKETIVSIEELNEDKLEPIDFTGILESSFNKVIQDDNHREIKGKNFSIDFFTDDELVSNKMLSLYGENGLFELIKLAKQHGWQIFDTGLGTMIDLENPENKRIRKPQKVCGANNKKIKWCTTLYIANRAFNGIRKFSAIYKHRQIFNLTL